ncbi:MAG: hypothetical protein U0822_18625 [Anaerolineae bacterium]
MPLRATILRLSSGFWILVAILVLWLLGTRLSHNLNAAEVLTQGMPKDVGNLVQSLLLTLRAILFGAAVLVWLLDNRRWLKIAALANAALLALDLLGACALLLGELLQGRHYSPAALIGDGILIIAMNILLFSLLYWIIDSDIEIFAGPEGKSTWDFLFPQRASELPGYAQWKPRYVDYVFLAYSTTVAFSATDTAPLSRLAKVLMIIQSVISLIAIVAVLGLAINSLGSGP